MRDGRCYRLPLSELLISATAGGASPSFPTPMRSDGIAGPQPGGTRFSGAKATRNLAGAVMWPTPLASDGTKGPTKFSRGNPSLGLAARTWATPTVKGNNNRAGCSAKAGDGLATQAGGALNHEWVAWLMCWPLLSFEMDRATAARALSARLAWKEKVTGKSRSRRRSRGSRSEAR
jgi:hypothetical protein